MSAITESLDGKAALKAADDDVARSIAYAVGQPTHVDVDEVLIRPTDQEP